MPKMPVQEGEDPDPTPYLFVSLEQKRIDQTKPYDAKKACWVPDEKEGYLLGEIKATKGDLVTVSLPGGEEKTLKKELIAQVNPPKFEKVEDMADLTYLNEASVLHNLRQRYYCKLIYDKNFKKEQVTQVNPPKYEKCEDMSNLTYLNDASVLHNLKQRYYHKLIYTYSGLFCVAINPYKRYPVYTNRCAKLYRGKRRNEVPPHIFAISDGAYVNMLTNRENQSMLITGESGAGKTENTKKVIAYFATVGASQKKDPNQEKKGSLEDQVVQTNPVLEAFGNAKTVRNDNSSRFGKFIRIHFGPSGKLAGADIETYLLEKARVISQQTLERSYHIFYQMMSGSVKGLKEMCNLSDDIYEYYYISQGKTSIPNVDDGEELQLTDVKICLLSDNIYDYYNVSQGKITIPNVDDGEECVATDLAFDVLGFTQQEKDDCYKITASVMHMGGMKFKQRGREEQAEADGTEEGARVAKLLGVDMDELYKNFLKPRIKVGNEFVTQGRNKDQVAYSIGAMSKGMFDRVFKWLVKKCNETLDTKQKRQHFIGVLDIAGFEIFDYNGFEQLCINFTNEKLQQFFNHHMFVLEQEEYKKEGINWAFIDFGMDLLACIDLIEKYNGFEQLCINFTNEKLQQFFNHHMFVLEQEEYKKEGINWDFIDFGMDLLACIDLIEKYNGFEQLCINFTNEKLQQFFNHHMFVLEQEEYKKEGIHWDFIDFGMDLLACIDLIEKVDFDGHLGQRAPLPPLYANRYHDTRMINFTIIIIFCCVTLANSSLFEMFPLHWLSPVGLFLMHQKVELDLSRHIFCYFDYYNGFEQLCINFTNEKLQQFFNHHMFVLEQEEYKREGINWDFIDFGMDLVACIDLIEKFNGFEQLCINFTNEKLQQFFNHHMFVLEQEEYQREGIEWTFIDFGMDLQACIELIEKIKVSGTDKHHLTFASADNYKVFLLKRSYLEIVLRCNPKLKSMNRSTFLLVNSFNQLCINFTNEKLQQFFNHHMFVLEQEEYEREGIPWTFIDFGMDLQPTISLIEKPMGILSILEEESMFPKATDRTFEEKLMNNHLGKSPNFQKPKPPKPGQIPAHFAIGHYAGTVSYNISGWLEKNKDPLNDTVVDQFKKGSNALLVEIFADHPGQSGAPDAGGGGKGGVKRTKGSTFQTVSTLHRVFFRAGVLGQMEELRDDRLGKIISWLQAWIRGYLARKEYKKLQDQRIALQVVQRNLRKYLQLRTWPWWKLWQKVKPMLNVTRVEDEIKKLEEKAAKAQEAFEKEEKLRKEVEALNTKLIQEKTELLASLEGEKGSLSDFQEKTNKLQAQKADLESQLHDTQERLQQEEDARNQLFQGKKKLEQEISGLKKDIEDLELAIQKIRNLNDEIAHQDELINKLNKEKKNQGETNQKTAEELQAAEDKVNHLNKVKAKLEQTLDELEDSLEREKKLRGDVEKAKRKVEGDLKLTQEAVSDLERNKKELEQTIQRKDKEISSLAAKLEDEQSLVAKNQKQIKELQSRIEELEEEVEAERQARAKAEKQRSDLARELEELGERLEEAGGATSAQIELNKKREAELAKLRRDLEEANIQHESTLANLRKKHNDAVAEMGEQIDQLNKLKAKAEKDKAHYAGELNDLRAGVDHLSNEKAASEKVAKQLQHQLNEVQSKLDETNRTLNDFDAAKKKLSIENSDLLRQLEEAESQVSQLGKLKISLTTQLEDTKRLADEESRERATLLGKFRNLEHDLDNLREQVEEEAEGKADIQRQLSKANAEAQLWRSKYESEGVARAEELEEAKRKLQARLAEAEETIESLNQKVVALEKTKQRLATEVEDLQLEVDRASAIANAAEKKQKAFDKIIGEWKLKVDDLAAELDASQKECRNYSTELFRLKGAYEEGQEQLEAVRRENKNLAGKIHLLLKNHQRALDSMQASLEAEAKGKAEALRLKKKLEADINELEIALDHANKANAESQKNIKRYQQQLKDVQTALEEEQRARDDARELLGISERRANALQNELEESRTLLEQADRGRRQAEQELSDAHEQLNELSAQNTSISAAKRKLESELQTLHSDLDELLNEAKNSEEKAKKAMVDAARLADELRAEQDHAQTQEKLRKALETQIKELQVRLDEAESNALKGGKKAIQKLEQRVRELENELDGEQRRHADAQKNLRKSERRIKELSFQGDEDRKNHERMQDLVDKLQQKIKTYKRQIEEAEEIAALNLAKFRKAQQELEEAEERADLAEQAIAKFRAKGRSGSAARALSPPVSLFI
ncbi:Myosin heavy chain [Blattella germanica]|nr:Myosin heavy chain [Blattella germanica]